MLNRWFQDIPSDPLHDLLEISGSKDHMEKIVNGIDPRSNRPLSWNPLQIAMTWNDVTKIREVVEELVLMGADMNGMAACGLNALHLLLLLFFRRNNEKEDVQFLEWWLAKGADAHAFAVVFDKKQKQYRILSPLDMLLGLYSKTLSLHSSSYFPGYCVPFLKKRATIKKTRLKTIVGLLLCYGAQSSERSLLLEEVRSSLATMPFHSPSYPFLRDYTEARFKLPLGLSFSEIRRRLSFLDRNARYVDHDDIVRHREIRYFKNVDKNTGTGVYANPDLEDKAEFMPYEYLGYVDVQQRPYYFHKTMVPSILQSKENPFTREVIPLETRRQWFHEMSDRPYIFQQVRVLRDTVTSEKGLVYWDATENKEEKKKKYFTLQFAHDLLAHNFPYTNIHHISTLHPREIRYVCHLLCNDPYLISQYCDCPMDDGALDFFSRQTIVYLMDDSLPLDLLHFGVEEAIQDISCYHLVRKLLQDFHMSFQEPFLDVITSLPDVGDVIRDRIGYVHLGYFHEIWQRLVFMERIFS